MYINILNKSYDRNYLNEYQHTPDFSTFHITMQMIIITEREREREREREGEREREREREIATESGALQGTVKYIVDLIYYRTPLNKDIFFL